MKTSRI